MVRIALITGAASGIGRAAAFRFRREGFAVVAADADLAGAQSTVALIRESEPAGDAHNSCAAQVDVADRDSVTALFATLKSQGIQASAVVNCAGINPKREFLDMELDEWNRIIGVNLTGTFLVSLQAARTMPDGGAIVNIGSINAEMATSQISAYAASKGGIRSLTKAMAVALAPHGIRVNAIAPGPCETNLTAMSRATAEGRARLLSRVALGRLGQPGEIASVAYFLASADSSFVTGETIIVDGGISASR
jgi:glucose 1-dehydrogenase